MQLEVYVFPPSLHSHPFKQGLVDHTCTYVADDVTFTQLPKVILRTVAGVIEVTVVDTGSSVPTWIAETHVRNNYSNVASLY